MQTYKKVLCFQNYSTLPETIWNIINEIGNEIILKNNQNQLITCSENKQYYVLIDYSRKKKKYTKISVYLK